MVMAFHNIDEGHSQEVHDQMVEVGPHRVSGNVSQTLKLILDKHGDIAKDFELESGNILSFALENICNVVQSLETIKYTEFTQKHLNSFYAALRDAEKLKLNVKWLHDGLDKICQTVTSFNRYKEIEGAKKKALQRMESIKEKLASKKAEIQELERQLESEAFKISEFDRTKDEIVSKWKSISNTCLSNGIF